MAFRPSGGVENKVRLHALTVRDHWRTFVDLYGWTIAGSAEGHRRCTVCGEPAYLMGKHPETTLYRCTSYSHCFSTIDEIVETYDPSYYEAAHRRWFENPNIALFERIRNALDHRSGLRIIDVGCGRGHLLRYLESKRPDAHFFGIDLSPNENTKRIKYSQGCAELAQHFVAPPEILLHPIDESRAMIVHAAGGMD